MSSKGKSPWMIYNGEEVADSQFCIDHLNKLHGLDYNSHLSEEQRAAARAFQKLTEENLYWYVWGRKHVGPRRRTCTGTYEDESM